MKGSAFETRRQAPRRSAATSAIFLALAGCVSPALGSRADDSILWRFDRLESLGGLPTRVEGEPRLQESPFGTAVAFDGIDDALFVQSHPLAGATNFTMEAIFRPDGGAVEQRWFHLAEATAEQPPGVWPSLTPAGPRFLFEIRVTGNRWYLDAFTAGNGYSQALMFPEKTHELGRWYHVAQVYNGRTYRSYVDGVLQGEAPLVFRPQGQGYASIGTRLNRRDYFKGAVAAARFTRRALDPADFLRLPASKAAVRLKKNVSPHSRTNERKVR